MNASLNNFLLLSLIGKKGGNIDINLEHAQAVNDQPLQLADTATAAQPPTHYQTQSSSSTSPELSSKSEVASNIGNLHVCSSNVWLLI